MDCLELLARIASWSFDGSRLVDVACIAFDSVSASHVYELREQYRQQILDRVRVGCGGWGGGVWWVYSGCM